MPAWKHSASETQRVTRATHETQWEKKQCKIELWVPTWSHSVSETQRITRNAGDKNDVKFKFGVPTWRQSASETQRVTRNPVGTSRSVKFEF